MKSVCRIFRQIDRPEEDFRWLNEYHSLPTTTALLSISCWMCCCGRIKQTYSSWPPSTTKNRTTVKCPRLIFFVPDYEESTRKLLFLTLICHPHFTPHHMTMQWHGFVITIYADLCISYYNHPTINTIEWVTGVQFLNMNGTAIHCTLCSGYKRIPSDAHFTECVQANDSWSI